MDLLIKVESLEHLWKLRQENRSVIGNVSWCRKPRPAAFVINMSGSHIFQAFKLGLYEYEKEYREMWRMILSKSKRRYG